MGSTENASLSYNKHYTTLKNIGSKKDYLGLKNRKVQETHFGSEKTVRIKLFSMSRCLKNNPAFQDDCVYIL